MAGSILKNTEYEAGPAEQETVGMGYKAGTEINAIGGSQPRKEEGASHHARRGKNAEAFLKWNERLPW